MKIVICHIILFFFLIFPSLASAADNNYATWVIPVRGREFWRQGSDISHLTNLTKIVSSSGQASTWLLHYDVLSDKEVLSEVKSLPNPKEIGIFLEITRNLALDSKVNYPWETEKWERADKVFLSGYSLSDRKKLIDTVMAKYQFTFGQYPKSVGAWNIDGWSLDYLSKKYGVIAVLGCSDQYITDGYQLWGQYIGFPYYPSKGSVIEPALNNNDKIPVVKLQWAPREPLLSYGSGGHYSNFSAQANDFGRSKGLGMNYFSQLLRTYTSNISGHLSQITLGMEVGELETKYLYLISEQFNVVNQMHLKMTTMEEFANIYKSTYPNVSPEVTISSSQGNRSITWYMSPLFRAAILTEGAQRKLVDLHYYHTSNYADNDWTEADKRQNLYQIVPATVDMIGLGNSRDLVEGKPDFLQNAPEAKTITSFGRISFQDRLRQLFGHFIPDFRASNLNGKWVFGLAINPETLCLIGCEHYKFPIMEAFLNLDRFRYPDITLYGRQEDTLANFAPKGQKIIKGVSYGITNLDKELNKPKLFENNSYLVIESN